VASVAAAGPVAAALLGPVDEAPAMSYQEVDLGPTGADPRDGAIAAVAVGHRHRPVVVTQALSKLYGEGEAVVRALWKVDLRIERGEYVAVMGASGSGKSTLMQIIGCLDAPTTGRYFLDGIDVRDLDEDQLAEIRNSRIGFVFQSFNLIPRTTALSNVELPLVYAGEKRSVRRERALEALRSVGLESRIDHTPNQLSGGQQQRVALARAIVTNPAMILADEPTGALDSRSTHEVLDLFDRLNSEGRTVVVITHEHDVAARCRRVVRLLDGQIVDDGHPDVVLGAMT
jgi:putative ABC transport system ATP-binding protein